MKDKESQKFTKEELYCSNEIPKYKNKYLKEISFPLGGIGTGSIGLNGRGSLIDFEIYNRPNVGSKYPKCFPLIRVKATDEDPICRVLEGPIMRPYTPIDGGRIHFNAEGFPHMDEVEFTGEYPFAWIDFKCEKLPIEIQLEAYNPYIPCEPDLSGIPCAILKYKVKNTSSKKLDVSILWSLLNFSSFSKEECRNLYFTGSDVPTGHYLNTYLEDGGVKGIIFGNFRYPENHGLFGNVALTTPDKEVTFTPYWYQGPWFSGHYKIWDYFKENGELKIFHNGTVGRAEAGAISIKKTLNPSEEKIFTFYITWYFPNYVKYWNGWSWHKDLGNQPTWENYYAQFYEDAFDVAIKLNKKEKELHNQTLTFHDALFSTTVPYYVLDAVSANMSILKTTTCMRLFDGTFYGFEGCHPSEGCCEGSCTHVWGYQQTLPFLFPSLERSMHNANYKYNFIFPDCGALEFRIQLPLGAEHKVPIACADGQLGGIMHVYREWKISGDTDWLKSVWFGVKRALEFAWEEWDEDKTGVLREFQHNTYDIEFEGPNSMLTSYYLGALKAGAEMAKIVGEEEKSKEYIKIYEKGRKWVDENLFNGEYYIQKYDPKRATRYQVGPGCLIDQLVGLQIGRMAGLPNYFEETKIKSALKSIFKYNFKTNMREHENGARLYAINDEAGVVLCTWPKGGRPELSFPYCDEVMNGFEYQFASHCITEDLIEEGLTVIKAIRDRYDGWGRNPWNEFECGHHYARSMAAYGGLVALSGFEFNKSKNYIGFHPKINKNSFKTFWSIGNAWGTYEQDSSSIKLELLYGELELSKIKIGDFQRKNNIQVNFNNMVIPAKISDDGSIIFEKNLLIQAHESLEISFR